MAAEAGHQVGRGQGPGSRRALGPWSPCREAEDSGASSPGKERLIAWQEGKVIGSGRRDRRAGQALHRLLLHAATRSVFASLYTQPLEHELTRVLIQDRLALPGAPQMLLQLGLAHASQATPRRAPEDVIG
jgi:hypothetical protein